MIINHALAYRRAYFSQHDVNSGRKRWVKALCESLRSTRPQCPEISDRELAYFLMNKTDAFLQQSVTAKKCAARVTGLQAPPSWDPSMKRVWVLNSEVHLDEDGHTITPTESPYVWLEDLCSARHDLLQPETGTGQHMIADPTKSQVQPCP